MADKLSDELIMRNYYNFQSNLINEEEMQVNPTAENILKPNDVEEIYPDGNRNAQKSDIASNLPSKNENKRNNNQSNSNGLDFERLSVDDELSSKKYYEFDDIVRKLIKFT